jgi:hypothetical protein
VVVPAILVRALARPGALPDIRSFLYPAMQACEAADFSEKYRKHQNQTFQN